MDDFTEELARRFAASYISVWMHTAFTTEYRKVKEAPPGELWLMLARLAMKAVLAHGEREMDFMKLEVKGPLQ